MVQFDPPSLAVTFSSISAQVTPRRKVGCSCTCSPIPLAKPQPSQPQSPQDYSEGLADKQWLVRCSIQWMKFIVLKSFSYSTKRNINFCIFVNLVTLCSSVPSRSSVRKLCECCKLYSLEFTGTWITERGTRCIFNHLSYLLIHCKQVCCPSTIMVCLQNVIQFISSFSCWMRGTKVTWQYTIWLGIYIAWITLMHISVMCILIVACTHKWNGLLIEVNIFWFHHGALKSY